MLNEARFGYNSLYNIIGQQLAGIEDVDTTGQRRRLLEAYGSAVTADGVCLLSAVDRDAVLAARVVVVAQRVVDERGAVGGNVAVRIQDA